ncbi:MAG: hypothetical protein R3C99_28290, partial [Pirellulaceae bacterium]
MSRSVASVVRAFRVVRCIENPLAPKSPFAPRKSRRHPSRQTAVVFNRAERLHAQRETVATFAESTATFAG